MSEFAPQPDGGEEEVLHSEQEADLFPLENREALNKVAIQRIKRLRALSEFNIQRQSEQDQEALSTEKAQIYAWFKTAMQLTWARLDTVDWPQDLHESLEQDPAETKQVAEFYDQYILRPLTTEINEEHEVARKWLKEQTKKRGVTFQGVGGDPEKYPDQPAPTLDFDSRIAWILLRRAGVIDDKTKVNQVRHAQFEKGMGQDAAIIVDISKGDSEVVSNYKSDVAEKLRKHTGEFPEEKDESWIPLNKETASLILDHHGPESTPESGSSARKTYNMLVGLGLLRPTQELEDLVSIVDAEDDKTYLKPGFEIDPKSFVGLWRAQVPDKNGKNRKWIGFFNTGSKKFERPLLQLIQLTGGDITRHIEDEELEKLGLLETANEVQTRLEAARNEIDRLKTEGEIIRELPDGTYVAFDTDGALDPKFNPALEQLDTPSLLYEAGILTKIKWTVTGEKGSMFVNCQDNPELLVKLQKLHGGDLVRDKMWLWNGPKDQLPTRTDLEVLLGLEPSGPERAAEPLAENVTAEKTLEQESTPDWKIELDELYDRYRPERTFDEMGGKAVRSYQGFWAETLTMFSRRPSTEGLQSLYNDGLRSAREAEHRRMAALTETERRERLEMLRNSFSGQEELDKEYTTQREQGNEQPQVPAQVPEWEKSVFAEKGADIKEIAGVTYQELRSRRSLLTGVLKERLMNRVMADPELREWMFAFAKEADLVFDQLTQLTKTGGEPHDLRRLQWAVATITGRARYKIQDLLVEEENR